ncbi:MAG TPA: hypothetical protein VGM03_08765, partial [Phycisphaerae bacterium]
MSKRQRLAAGVIAVAGVVGLLGCASYPGVVKPFADLKPLSSDLAIFENDKIEIYLAANARPAFPCTLAVAKLLDWRGPYAHRYERSASSSYALEVISGPEAEGWRKLAEKPAGGGEATINQVQFI